MERKEQKPKLKIALPDGHLQDGTRDLFIQAGFELKGYEKERRNYRPELVDEDKKKMIEIKVLRPPEIPLLVAQGAHDVGVTGLDWLEETKRRAKVKRLLDLEYGRVSLVLAIPLQAEQECQIRNVNDFLRSFWKGKNGVRIATEYVRLAEDYVSNTKFYRARKKRGEIGRPGLIFPWMTIRGNSRVKVILSYGVTEAKPPEDADGIIDNRGTGETLRKNNLTELDTVLEKSTAWLIANPYSLADEYIGGLINSFKEALEGVVTARQCLHIFANFRGFRTKELRESDLWGLAHLKPTVVESEGVTRVDLLVKRDEYDAAMKLLKKHRARDIVALQPQSVLSPSEPDKR